MKKPLETRGRGKPTRLAPRCFLVHVSSSSIARILATTTVGPPVPVPEQGHQARHEERPDQGRVDRDGERDADPDLLDDHDRRRGERADGDAEEQRRRGDDPPGPFEAERDRLAVLETGVVRLLDPREQEDRRSRSRARMRSRTGARAASARAHPGCGSSAGPRAGRPGRSARAGRTRPRARARSSGAPSAAARPTA